LGSNQRRIPSPAAHRGHRIRSADASKPFETSNTTGVVLARTLRINTCMPAM